MLSQLKQVRTEFGLDIDKISRHLNIRKKYLVALEEGNIDALPGRVYASGYLKLYAQYLGLSGLSDAIAPQELALSQENKYVADYKFKTPVVVTSIIILIITLTIYYDQYANYREITSTIEMPNQAEILYDQ